MKNNRLGCMALFLGLLLCFSLFLNVALFTAGSAKLSKVRPHAASRDLPNFNEAKIQPARKGGHEKIVQIELSGIITSDRDGDYGDSMVEQLKAALHQAAQDDKVKAIVLHIDSPGGEVTASDTIYNAVRLAREKKPVVVYMGSLAASGGYYAACGGSHLMANETSTTGSIGVIISTLNYRQLLGKIGLEAVVFKSGKFKDMLSGAREMTPEEREYIQGLVGQTYDKFVGIVARERKLPEAELRTGLADGRVITGKDALAAKLIDGTGYIEDAYDKARELGKAPDAGVVRYERGFQFGNLLRLFGSGARSSVTLDVPALGLPGQARLQPGRMYLLPSTFAP